MFDWVRNNLSKIRAHRIKREEAEQPMLNGPIPIYAQDVDGELRFVYYGETPDARGEDISAYFTRNLSVSGRSAWSTWT